MNVQELIEKSTTLFSIIYEDEKGLKKAKVCKTEIGVEIEKKKIMLKGFKIIEIKKINCKGEDFEKKVEDEVRKNENLDELKKEVKDMR